MADRGVLRRAAERKPRRNRRGSCFFPFEHPASPSICPEAAASQAVVLASRGASRAGQSQSSITACCCCGKRGRTWRSGSGSASWCGREAEMPGAAEPARPSPHPGAQAATTRGRTVFQIPSRVDGVSFTVHPLGRSEPSDPFPVVGINQGETPAVEVRAWTTPSQVRRAAPSPRPAALLAPPPPSGDLSGGPAPAAAGCSCSLLLPLPKNVSWSFI